MGDQSTKVENSTKIGETNKLMSIFFICTKMGDEWVALETLFLVFYCLSPNRYSHGSPPLEALEEFGILFIHLGQCVKSL